MTKETKIGLLVGLAVIIAAGVLLSDQVTTAAAPPEAALAGTADEARQANLTPGPQSVIPIFRPATAAAGDVPPPAGPAADPLLPEPARPVPVMPVVPMPEPELAADTPDTPELAPRGPGAAGAADPWAHLADATADRPPLMAVAPPEPRPADPPAPRPAADAQPVRPYVARPGDSLSKIARAQLGADTPENRAAVVALNPSLQKDPNRILAGATYDLPGTAPAPEVVARLAPAEPAEPAAHVVRPGDSLWKIAAARADKAADVPAVIAAIRALNPGALGDTDVVVVGATLKLPAE